jgi:hypothetical protein
LNPKKFDNIHAFFLQQPKMSLDSYRESYLYLKYIIQNNIYSDVDIIITNHCLKSGLSPFTPIQDNKSLFELAIDLDELFPHIYGVLNLDSVVEVTAIS